MTGRVLLGTQSWNFRAWCGPFYPAACRAPDMLRFYGRVFPTLEVDSTFYGAPPEVVLREWYDRVPTGFRFSLKLPQQITHDRGLIDTDELLARFLGRASALEDKLGPLLIQLGPDFLATPEHRAALRAFVGRLPEGYRWAIEFRHADWSDESVLELLRGRGVCHVLADGRWYSRAQLIALAERPTADFAYLRWMGEGRRLTDYSRPQVDREVDRAAWADVIAALRTRVETVYGYFNNQYEGHSPHSAREMQRRLGLEVVEPTDLHPQRDLFGA